MGADIRVPHSLVTHAVERLDAWLERNGWAGYDPYDFKGLPFFTRLQNHSCSTLKNLCKLCFMFEETYPLAVRQFFKIPKQINAKGMGLFAKGYLNLYQITEKEDHKSKALECLDWLQTNPSPQYSGMCWGYPFDWQSKVFIPKGTPSAVVTSVIGDAFWSAYKLFQNESYLDVCRSICDFLISDLNIDKLGSDCICFSYTPLDNFHVHNANLFAAEFLARIGRELDRKDYLQLACQAANYALQEQNPDGSIFYWGRTQNHYSPNSLDHFHSGFEMRLLYGIWKATNEQNYLEAVKRYHHFYLQNFILRENGFVVPKMTPDSKYAIDIHTCSEAILCNSVLAEEMDDARVLLPGLISWVIPRMQHESGYFIYQILKTWSRERKVAVPYIRWAQAWMLLALSSYLLLTQGDGNKV